MNGGVVKQKTRLVLNTNMDSDYELDHGANASLKWKQYKVAV